MHFALDLSVIQSFLERKQEESGTDDDECISDDDDDSETESSSISSSGSKRGEYSFHDIGYPAIWWLKKFLIPKQSMHLLTSKDPPRPSKNAPSKCRIE